MPMPPLTLSSLLHQNIRPCNASDVLANLADMLEPLAHKQQRVLQICELPQSLEVAVEESTLRQALSNLIEGALLRTNVRGTVEIASTNALAGGALIIIDDDGPDMHYMTQMHALTLFGEDLLSEGMVEDNMMWNFVAGLTFAREILENYGCVLRVISPRCMHALTLFGEDLLSEGMVEDNMMWNFVAGLTFAREILENYGCVLRVISPRCMEAALGGRGTRVEIWLLSFSSSSSDGPAQAA